ncbi:MAG: chemotaxis protein CheW [Rhodospirillaceae bacterium]|nr:MAG: chemotaxis protein CheW [Rhodospirillaceae bacterium]
MVTFFVADQIFGLSAYKVRDVLRAQPLTRVPLAAAEIAGAINLRGHIVTAIDVRARLGAPAAPADASHMCVVVERSGEQFCLVVDAVGDVITVDSVDIEPTPSFLPTAWAQVSGGIYRMQERLLLLLDVEQLLSY